MICTKCQFENREGAKFCNECGHRFEIARPECGTANRLGSKFCDECGHDLRKPTEAPSIDYSQPQSYTPKHLADKILTTRSSIEGERKLVTVLFADVANYTSIDEKLDPEEVHQIMDGCFKILMDEIHRYEGTINQFTGDSEKYNLLFGSPRGRLMLSGTSMIMSICPEPPSPLSGTPYSPPLESMITPVPKRY